MKNKYEIRGDHAVIFLRCKDELIETKVCLKGLERAKEFKNTWYAYWNVRRKTYIVRGNSPMVNGERRGILFSRWLMGEDSDLFVDHINRDTLDNRYENLRYADNSLNGHNRNDFYSRNKTTGYRGVHFEKRSKRFVAYLTVNKKRIVIGQFKNFEEAKRAVDRKRRELVPEVFV